MTDDDKKPEDGLPPTARSASEDPAPAELAAQTGPEYLDTPEPSGPAPDLRSDPGIAGPVPAPADMASAPAPRRGGGFVAPLLGGALALAAGFALSHYNIFELRSDASQTEARFAALETALKNAQAETGAAASAAGQKAEKALSLAQELSERAGQGAAAEIDALQARLAAAETALSALAETAPDGSVPAAAFASLKAEVDSLKSAGSGGQAAADPEAIRALIGRELDARAAEITAKAEEEATALRETARREAAFNALAEAVNNGQPYAAALAALELDSPPEALSSHAESGITSLAGLVAGFPDAARRALEASLRGEGGQSLSERAWSMLRIGTGARSLSPQQGTDPDAVLSRAEAAAQAGDLATALSELEALPAPGKAAMADWSRSARARLDAAAALAALSAQHPQ